MELTSSTLHKMESVYDYMCVVSGDQHRSFLLSCGVSLPALLLPLPRIFIEWDHLAGLVVKASALRAKDPGFHSRLCQYFFGWSHTIDLKIEIPVATLPGAWRCRVSAWTGWPGVSILWLGEIGSVIYNFYLSVAACTIVWAEPTLGYTSMLLGC